MATCTLTLNVGYGADAPQARGVIKINRIERGDNGSMVVTVGQQEIPMVYPFPAVELEQGVTYRFVESWAGGITRYCTIPLAATADYSDLTDVTPVPPAYAGVLTDAITGAEVDENGDLIVTHLDTSTSNAGNVIGPKGDNGDTTAVTALGDVSGTLDLSSFTGPATVTARLTGNITAVTLPDPDGLAYTITLRLAQDGTGSRTFKAVGVSTAYSVAPVLSTAANAVDVLHLISLDGTNWTVMVGAMAVGIPAGWVV